MKILVTSDMHGAVQNFETALEREKDAKNVIFLGDGINKAEEISFMYSDKNFYMVSGNCDGIFTAEPPTKIITLGGVKILITHGHPYSVKSSLSLLLQRAEQEGVKIALYGHTHIANVEQRNGIWLVNPGTLYGYNGLCSYSTIDITDGKIYPKIVKI